VLKVGSSPCIFLHGTINYTVVVVVGPAPVQGQQTLRLAQLSMS